MLPGKWELEQSAEGQVSNSTDILRPRPESHPLPHVSVRITFTNPSGYQFHGSEKGWHAKFPEQQGRNLKVNYPVQWLPVLDK